MSSRFRLLASSIDAGLVVIVGLGAVVLVATLGAPADPPPVPRCAETPPSRHHFHVTERDSVSITCLIIAADGTIHRAPVPAPASVGPGLAPRPFSAAREGVFRGD